MNIHPLVILLFFVLSAFHSHAQQAELEVQTGHTGWIKHISFSNDGKFLVSAGLENKIIIWDMVTKMQLRTLSGHNHYINSIAVSNDSKYILSSSVDNTVRLWEMATGKCINVFTGFKYTVSLTTFSPDGNLVALGGGFGELKIFETTSGIKKLDLIGHDDHILTAAFSHDGSKLYTAGYGPYVFRWNTVTGEKKKMFSGLSHPITTLVVSGYNNSFVTGGTDEVLLFWDDRIAAPVRSIKIDGNADNIRFINSDIFVLHKNNSIIEFWSFLGREKLRSDSISKRIEAFAADKDGKIVATATSSLEIDLWETGNMHKLATLKSRSAYVNAVAVDPVTGRFAAAYSDKTIRIWNTSTANIVRTMKGHAKLIKDLKFTSDGKTLISGGADETLIAWNVEDGSVKYKLTGFTGNIETIALLEAFNVMAIGGDEKIYIKKISDGTDIQDPLGGKISNIQSVTFSPDKKYLAAACGIFAIGKDDVEQTGYIAYWNLDKATDTEFFETGTEKLTDIAFSPSSDKMAVVSEDGYLKVIDINTKKIITSIKDSENYIKKLLWLDDNTVITGDRNGNIRQWNIATSQREKEFSGHTSFVDGIGLSNDRTKLISCSDDNTVRLWDLNTAKQLASFIALSDSSYISIAPGNYYLSNRSVTNGVAFRKDQQLFPFSQFDLQYNRPDLLLKSVGYASDTLIESYRKAYLKRLKRAGFDESVFSSDMNIPSVSVMGKEKIAGISKNEKAAFSVSVKDEKYSIRSLLIAVNGVPYHDPGFILKAPAKQYVYNVAVPLSQGENTIECSALNEKGAESYREIFKVVYQPVKKERSKTYFIGIGINQYKDSSMNLTYAAQDIRDLAALIRKKYPDVIIDTLLDTKATKQNILALKKKLLASSVEDRIIVSISGHGLLDKSLNFYFATHDIDFSDPQTNGLLYDELESLLSDIPSRKKILLIDACHSGEVDRDDQVIISEADKNGVKEIKIKSTIRVKQKKAGLQNSFELMKELFADLSRSNGSAIISAAGGYEYAFEDAKYNNGVFTYCLKKGLIEMAADTNADGTITVNELKDYVSRQVSSLTSGRQRPTSRRELEYDWVLW